MKNRTNLQKSRRKFIQSMGVSVAGISVLPTSLYPSITNSNTAEQTAGLNLNLQEELQSELILPEGVSATWDIEKAYHETTVTRERICINGLWKWQPGKLESVQPPATNWGYFKVPGNWPGISNYLQKESQRMFAHPAWKENSFRNLEAAWYKREVSIPNNWINRQIILCADYLNSIVVVFINDIRIGEILFPSGKLDLTSVCTPGEKYTISMKVTVLPLSDVVAVFSDSNAPRTGKGQVDRRGLCGDVFLCSIPLKENISDVKVSTSYRKEEITFNIGLENLTPGEKYFLNAIVTENGNRIAGFKSRDFTTSDLKDGLLSFTEYWLPDKLWDIHTPQNMYEVKVSLLANDKTLLDTTVPSRFGFREFWIEGRDFYLNGSRIFLSSVPFDNMQIGAALSTYEAAKETMHRFKSFGINFVYAHNYGCEPGTHLSFEELLKAADDTGMLIAISQPHFGHYDWTATNAEQKNGYANHAKFYTQVAQNHPSVIFYSMNHNSCGYNNDMNPDMIDGLVRPDNEWSSRNAKRALKVEALVAKMDPDRIIYHHAGGNLGSLHSSNFYPNWVPVQEMSDWFEHWATVGVKPAFLCEYAAPFGWDWSLYRGWYKGKREFGSAPAPWEYCMAEWNSQFLGDKAFKISEYEKVNLRWEAKQFRDGKVWYRWDYPYTFDNTHLEERNPVLIMHLTDQWRAFRSWGLSANSPWDYSAYWKLREGAENGRKTFVIDWENLQRPGFSPDFNDRASHMIYDVSFDQSDWIPTAAEALLKNNMPLLAYIGGKSDAFTSKDHNFLPGTKLEKQLIVINNSRLEVKCECNWTLNLPEIVSGSKTISLKTGQQERIPLNFELPASLSAENYNINSVVRFSNGETQEDTFTINVLPSESTKKSTAKIALFDPKGETGKLLDEFGIQYKSIVEDDELTGFEILIVGKEALSTDGSGLNIGNIRNGLRVIIFEQTARVLEKRFGFRVQEYGLRKVFKRILDHPALNGLDEDNLCDWQGAATLLPPELKYEMNDNVFNGAPTVKWCDIPVTRIWRCGNRGNVASVLIEKPACGDFLPVVDGGFSLQYSPLMEYREGKGLIMFCQLDVSGRTEKEPAAELLAANIISYVTEWKPGIKKSAVYVGDEKGKSHLERTGFSVIPYNNQKLSAEQVLIVGPGGSQLLKDATKDISGWIEEGGRLLTIGLNQEEVASIVPFKVRLKKEEHISAYFKTLSMNSPFAGIGPSDVHNRSPKEISLVSEGASITGNGVLANVDNSNVVFCQLAPWQFDYGNEQHNVKQTFRRSGFLLSRIMGNLGIESSTAVPDRFNQPVDEGKSEKRWLDGLYLDEPEEWDDPYRFFRW